MSNSKKNQVEVVVNANSTNVTDKKTGKVVKYLKEGVTGGQLQKLKILANAEHKKDGKSISFCIKRAIEFGSEYFAAIKDFNVEDLTPANLIPLRTEHEQKMSGFSVWMVYNLIKRFYENKYENENKVVPSVTLVVKKEEAPKTTTKVEAAAPAKKSPAKKEAAAAK